MFYKKATYFTLEFDQGPIQALSIHNNMHTIHYLIIQEHTESFILFILAPHHR